ncbi:MAG TPA: cysteine desulfurase [Candidatus Thermoplasmatota archaeon]|nr:cysteine desulfurase [Candidatus Thermoplasmatota archaeon]
MSYDVEAVRRDFPVLARRVHGKPLVYLDNAATTQKPQSVIERTALYYREENANVHRAVHELSEKATLAYEAARARIARFVGARRPEEVVWTRGTTEAINLVARTHVRSRLRKGDEILVTGMEHHSNIVPWQILCGEVGAHLRHTRVTDEGEVDLGEFERLLGPRTRFVGLSHVSNALGTINPVAEMTRLAHDHGATVLVDGAQAMPHMAVDVQAIGCDFYAASGHKMYGPTGIGFLWARHELLEAMPPWQGGGDMIRSVSFEQGTTYNDPPMKFEAGTPNIAGVVGFATAVDYLAKQGLESVASHEAGLLRRATEALAGIEGVRIIGTARHKAAVVSFHVEGVHPHDIGSLLDRDGIAVRTGHHCAQPVMDRFGVPATTRASFGLYNTTAECDALGESLGRVVRMFQ